METNEEQITVHGPRKGKIFSALADTMAEVNAIAKDQKNTQQNFNYRGIDNVYNELHQLMVKHRVFSTPEVLNAVHEEHKTDRGKVLIYRILTIRYTFFADDGSSVSAVVQGEGMDLGDKASNKAMSIGHKYALLQIFLIPTDDLIDPNGESPQPASKKQERQQSARINKDQRTEIAKLIKNELITKEEGEKAIKWLNGKKVPSKIGATKQINALKKMIAERAKPAVESGDQKDKKSGTKPGPNPYKLDKKALQAQLNIWKTERYDATLYNKIKAELFGQKPKVADITLEGLQKFYERLQEEALKPVK